MTNKNNVTVTANAFYGYIDDSTPCGKAKVKQVKADMETLAVMLNDNNLTVQTKKAIYLDYAKAIRDYVEQEETCDNCTNDCTECDYYDEEEEDEEDYEEEEPYEAVVIIEDMDNFVISADGKHIECDTYEDTVKKIRLLEALGFGYDVYAYDSEDNEYPCQVTIRGDRIELEVIY